MQSAKAPVSLSTSSLPGRRFVFPAVLALGLFASAEASAAGGSTQLEADTTTQTEVATPLTLAPRVTPMYGMSFAEGPATAPAAQPAVLVAPPKGIGLIVGGSLTAALIGIPFTLWGATVIAAGQAVQDTGDAIGDETGATQSAGGIAKGVGIGFLITGLLGLGGGGTMIGFGVKNNLAYKRWKSENGIALTPTVGSTARRTATYGFAMQF